MCIKTQLSCEHIPLCQTSNLGWLIVALLCTSLLIAQRCSDREDSQMNNACPYQPILRAQCNERKRWIDRVSNRWTENNFLNCKSHYTANWSNRRDEIKVINIFIWVSAVRRECYSLEKITLRLKNILFPHLLKVCLISVLLCCHYVLFPPPCKKVNQFRY